MDAFIRKDVKDDEATNDCKTKYKCKRCNYVAKNAFLLTRHLSRKSVCDPIDAMHDVACNVLIDELNIQKESKQVHKCRVCGKGMATYQSRFVHEKAHVKEVLTGTNFLITKCAKELAKQNNTEKTASIPVNIINGPVNITNNIQINAFNKEDLSHVINDVFFLNQCIARTDKGLMELVGRIHFDPRKPENRNIRLTSNKTPHMKFYDGTSWKYEQSKVLISEVMDKSLDIMQDHFDGHKQEILKNKQLGWCSHIRKWMAQMEDKQNPTFNKCMKRLFTYLLNQK